MKRFVIIGGSEIRNYALIRESFRPSDYYVYCDCGLKHQESLGVTPDLIIGDPVVKDDTDTIFAVKEGIRRGYDDFLLIGATGGRQDHTLGNIYALLMLKNAGKSAKIIDDYSEMSIIAAGEECRVKNVWRFFSLLNISGTARGISITGAKFNLENAEILPEYQYGISNEVSGSEAVITLKEGNLLLVCVRK